MRPDAKKRPKTMRAKGLAMVHVAAKNQGLKQGSEDYKAWLQAMTGARSCSDLTDQHLMEFALILKQNGLTARKPLGGTGIDRPTPAQWLKLETSARKLGFATILDADFVAWIKRVTGLDNPRFLTAKTCSDAICGLDRWIEYLSKQG